MGDRNKEISPTDYPSFGHQQSPGKASIMTSDWIMSLAENNIQLILLCIRQLSQVDTMDLCADGRVQRDDLGRRREKTLLSGLGTETSVLDIERLEWRPLEIWVSRLRVTMRHR